MKLYYLIFITFILQTSQILAQTEEKNTFYIPIRENNKWGIADNEGNIILPAQYIEKVQELDSNIFLVKNKDKYGLVSAENNELLAPSYDEITLLNQFYFVRNGKLNGVIDKNFKSIIEMKYESVEQIDSAKFKIISDGKYGTLEVNGKSAFYESKDDLSFLKQIYDEVKPYDSAYFRILKDKKIGLADSLGHVLHFPQYEDIGKIYRFGKKSYVEIKDHSKWGIIDFKGNMILDTSFTEAKMISESLFQVKDDKKYTLLNSTKDTLITDCDQLSLLDNKYILYKKGNKMGLLTPIGKFLFEEAFKTHKFIDETHISFQGNNNLWTLFSTESNILFGKPKFKTFDIDELSGLILATGVKNKAVYNIKGESIVEEGKYQQFRIGNHQLIYTLVGGKTGLLNFEGKELLRPVYDAISDFKDDIGVTQIERFGKYGVINKKGRVILEPEFAKIAIYKTRTIAFDGYVWHVLKYDEKGNVTNHTVTRRGRWSTRQLPLKFDITFGKKAKKQNGLHWEKISRRDWALFNNKGENLLIIDGTEVTFDSIKIDPNLKLTLAKNYDSDKFSYVSYLIDHIKGKILFKADVPDIAIEDFKKGNWARTKTKSYWDGLVSKDGKRLINQIKSGGQNAIIENVGSFNKGLAWVKIGGKYGYINSALSLVIQPTYDKAENFTHLGVAKVMKDGLFGCISSQNAKRIPIDFEELFIDDNSQIIRGKHQGHWGGVNINNTVIIPFIFDHVFPYAEPSSFWSNAQITVRDIASFKKQNNLYAMVEKEGQYGLVNRKGNIILPTEYKKINFFWNGTATIQDDFGHFGLIDETGKILIQPIYDDLGIFNKSGVSIAKKQGKWGLVNIRGKEITGFEYDSLSYFNHKNVCVAKKRNMVGLLNIKGELELPLEYSSIEFGHIDYTIGVSEKDQYVIRKGKQAGLINANGTILVPAVLECDQLIYKNNIVYLSRKNGTFEGYADLKGNYLLKPIYTDAGNFEKNYLNKKGITTLKNGNAIGYADHTGKVLLPAEFTDLGALPTQIDSTSSIVASNKDGLYGIINFLSQDSVNYNYDNLTPFNDSVYLSYKNIHRYFFIDTLGRSSHAVEADTMFRVVHGMAKFRRDTLWGFVNSKGEEIVKPEYDEVNNYRQKVAYVRIKNKWGMVDMNGELIVPTKYDSLDKMHYGVAIAYIEGKATYVNNKGKEFFEPGTVECKPFRHHRAIVKKGRYLGMLDPQGNWLLEPKYSAIKKTNKSGLLKVSHFANSHRSWALVTNKGELLTEFLYYKIGAFHDGLAVVKTYHKKSENRRYGFINKKGTVVIPTKYNRADNFSAGMTRVVMGKKTSYITPTGKNVPKTIYFKHLDSLKKAKQEQLDLAKANADKAKEKVDDDENKEEKKGFETQILIGYQLNYEDKKGNNLLIKFDSGIVVTPTRKFLKQGEVYQLDVTEDGITTNRIIYGRKDYYEEVNNIVEELKSDPRKARYWKKYYDQKYKWTQIEKGTWHLFDEHMEILNKGKGYSDISTFHKGHAQVAVTGNVGLVGKQGNELIPVEYERIEHYKGDIYRTITGHSWAYINSKGKWIWKPKETTVSNQK